MARKEKKWWSADILYPKSQKVNFTVAQSVQQKLLWPLFKLRISDWTGGVQGGYSS